MSLGIPLAPRVRLSRSRGQAMDDRRALWQGSDVTNIAHPGPRKYRPTPLDSAELAVHPHRRQPGITPAEQMLVVVFLRRYVLWCAKTRRFDRLRNSLDLLIEVAAG